jgi:hypothetical protein
MKVHKEIRTTLRERRMIAKNGVFIRLSLDLGECCRIGTKTSSESLKHGLHTTLLQARRQTQVGAMRLVKDSKEMHSRSGGTGVPSSPDPRGSSFHPEDLRQLLRKIEGSTVISKGRGATNQVGIFLEPSTFLITKTHTMRKLQSGSTITMATHVTG